MSDCKRELRYKVFSAVSRIEDDFLVRLIREGCHIYVLDARDDDRTGGHIPGSIHVADSMESSAKMQLLSSLMDTIQSQRENEADVWIITHCMESAHRGPRLANLIHSKLPKELKDFVKIRILNRGAEGWVRKYFMDSSLVEDYDDDIWGFIAYHPLKGAKSVKSVESVESVDAAHSVCTYLLFVCAQIVEVRPWSKV